MSDIHVRRFFATYEDEYRTEEFDNPRTGEVEARARKTGKLREVHWVEYSKIGDDKNIMIEKVARILSVDDMSKSQSNPAILMAAHRKNAIEPLYNRWREGHAVTADGTPLAAWNGLSPEQSEHLKMRGISTVEQLSKLNDTHFQLFGIPGLRTLVDNARRFLVTLDNTVFVEQMAEKDQQIADLMERQAEMMEMMKEMQAQLHKGAAPAVDPYAPPEDFVDPTQEPPPVVGKSKKQQATA